MFRSSTWVTVLVDSDASRNLPGNGLGLSMVQAAAHAHGGTVELESVSGKGSTFTVHFPKER